MERRRAYDAGFGFVGSIRFLTKPRDLGHRLWIEKLGEKEGEKYI